MSDHLLFWRLQGYRPRPLVYTQASAYTKPRRPWRDNRSRGHRLRGRPRPTARSSGTTITHHPWPPTSAKTTPIGLYHRSNHPRRRWYMACSGPRPITSRLRPLQEVWTIGTQGTQRINPRSPIRCDRVRSSSCSSANGKTWTSREGLTGVYSIFRAFSPGSGMKLCLETLSTWSVLHLPS